jgi:5-methylcytosine-specific restriction enzyme subunit McrC
MHCSQQTFLYLTEYETRRFSRQSLPEELGVLLWRTYSRQVEVEFPSPKNGDCWQLTSLGWVGIVPLPPVHIVVLQPRVPLTTLWSMIAYTCDLPELLSAQRLVGVSSVVDLYDRLAAILAQRVLVRCRQGIYQTYCPRSERLRAVRGRVAVAAASRTPWAPHLLCHFEEQTADVEDNQILAWTLDQILRSHHFHEPTRILVERALRALRPTVTLRPIAAAACLGRVYDRLNEEYRRLHALCYFILAHTTPVAAPDDLPMLPFCIHMPGLFERFVAAWLERHRPEGWGLQAQERFVYDTQERLSFTIDLVIRDKATGAVQWVLDTKYKAPLQAPAAEDIAQVIAYAEASGAPEAILVYPRPLARPLNVQVGKVRVRSLAFPLDGPVDEAGERFVAALVQS